MERIDPYLVEIENVTKERYEALDTIDDMIDVLGKQIIRIAHSNDDFICTCCIRTARELFGLLKKYAREEDTERIRAEWKHITGRDIDID